MDPATFQGKRIVILGLARQGTALARFFVEQGARVTVSDQAPAEKLQAELAALEGLPVERVLGGHPSSLLEGCDLLCLSGGVPPQIPLVQEAIRQGIPLSNDSLLTLQLAPCPVIAITGSSGKTTTTTLVGQMLAESLAGTGRRVHVGGNIGTPLIHRLDQIGPQDWMVLELSSFQLELFDPAIAFGDLTGLGPDVAAILNVTPNHLDRHPSMAAYAGVKLNLLAQLKPSSRVILNGDDPVTQRLAPRDEALPQAAKELPRSWRLSKLLARAQTQLAGLETPPVFFSREEPLTAGAWLEEGQLVYQGQVICPRDAVKLRGDHNVSNLLAAAAISGAAGARVEAMAWVATTFTGVPHRLEIVRQEGGVTWINDSIATAPERALAALRSFPPGEQTLVLLAGGKDKNLPWEEFAQEVVARVNFLIGFGQAGPMIVETVKRQADFCQSQSPSCAVVQRLEEAVSLAAQVVGPNSVVLLSPGGTSYDAYKNFEERGEHFRRLVKELQTHRI